MPQAPADEDDPAVRRRWLIRAIVGLGFGIPIAIEGRTFYRLIESYFFDGGDGAGTDGTTGGNADDAVGVGDELLPDTAAVDTLTDAILYARSEGWRLEVTAEVENAGEAIYTLQLQGVTTESGHRERGSASTGRIQPGGTGSVSTGWPIPAGDEPATLHVVAIMENGDGATRTVDREVPLGQIPVSG